MKKLTFLLFLSFFLSLVQTSSFGQRISNNDIRLTYVKLPIQPLPKEIQTYSSKIHPGEISFKYIHLKNQTMFKIDPLKLIIKVFF